MTNAKLKKIIFADKDGTTRAPMAAEIYKSYRTGHDEEVLAKGVFVSFAEPLNQKVEAVMASDGIIIKDFSSSRITDDDITEDTLILTVDESVRKIISDKLEKSNEKNTFSISSYAKEELDIMDPYGGTLQSYGICYESMKNVIKKLIEVMEDNSTP